MTMTWLGILLSFWTQLGDFGTVRALFVQHPVVVAATEGGFFLYDVNQRRLLARRITSNPVDFAVAEPGNQMVYFVSGQDLYRWIRGTPRFQRLATLESPAQGLGLDGRYLWVDYGRGRVERRTFSGFSAGFQAPPEAVTWSGPRGELSRDDPRLGFLAPFTRWTQDAGEVAFTVFVEAWNRLYAGTAGLGLWIYDARTSVALDSVNPGVSGHPVVDLTVASTGTWWFATPRTLCRWQDPFTRVWVAGQRADFPATELQRILWTPEGLWIGTRSGLFLYVPDRFQWPTLKAWVTDLAYREGTLWIGTPRGAYRLDDDLRMSEGEVYRILPTHGGLVLLTDLGVAYWPSDSGAVQTLRDPLGWLDARVSTAGAVFRDTVWVSGTDGLVYWQPGDTTFAYLAMPFAPAEQPVKDVRVNARHILVASAFSVYDYRRSERHWQPLWEGVEDLGLIQRVYLNGDTLAVAGERGVLLTWP